MAYPGYKPFREPFLAKIIEVHWKSKEKEFFTVNWFGSWEQLSYFELQNHYDSAFPDQGPLHWSVIFQPGSVSSTWRLEWGPPIVSGGAWTFTGTPTSNSGGN